MDLKKRYWRRKSKKLFIKYSRLEQFEYNGGYNINFGLYGEDVIIVGTEDVKRYYIADDKESYKSLKHMLDLEINIRYSDTDS